MGPGRELFGLCSDGSEIPVEIGLEPIETPEGRFTLASVLDIRPRLVAEEAARRMAALVQSADDAILSKTLDGIIQSWNPAAERLLGYTEAEIVGRPTACFVPPERANEEQQLLACVKDGEKITDLETVRLRRDGTAIDVSVTVSPIHDARGRTVAASTILRDISERKHLETERRESLRELETHRQELERLVAERGRLLAESQRYQKLILDRLPSMIGYWDATLVNRFANEAYKSWFGDAGARVIGMRMPDLLGPELFEANRRYFEAALAGEPQTFERSIRNPVTGIIRHSLTHYLPDIVDGQVRGFHTLVHDVTEITENRHSLAKSLKEREVLLQEVHHRVKNNLQIISSLLSLQVRRLEVGPARHALEDCQRRVLAIALVHQQLYQAGDYTSVAFGRYLRSLATSAFQAAEMAGAVRLELAVDDLPVAVDLAIPCALLVNELITNALKHAFVGRERAGGNVRVALSRDGHELCLDVSDDGVGLPANFSFETATSMGSQLITTLTAQIGGTLAVSNEPGTMIHLRFPHR
jgi:PAS domain S-box-containing protein